MSIKKLKLTSEQRYSERGEEMLDLYLNQGLTQQQIADKFFVSRSLVCKIMLKLATKKHGKKLSELKKMKQKQ